VVTGIFRIGQESLFAEVDNLGVHTLLAPQFNTCFGFTEAEVEARLDRRGRGSELEAVRAGHNGYLFGGEAIYNPASVVRFLSGEDMSAKLGWLSARPG
jgi:hypothetical protein